MTFHPTACAEAVAMLTPRQREVLAGIASGRPRKQVADEMGISYATFKTHCVAVYQRLKINTTVEATRVAIAAGLTQ